MKFRVLHCKNGWYALEKKTWFLWEHIQWYSETDKDRALHELSRCISEERTRRARKDAVICEEKV